MWVTDTKVLVGVPMHLDYSLGNIVSVYAEKIQQLILYLTTIKLDTQEIKFWYNKF